MSDNTLNLLTRVGAPAGIFSLPDLGAICCER
jgi:hypothetical protein